MFRYLLFGLQSSPKRQGAYVGSQNWQIPRPTSQTGSGLCKPSRVRVRFWSLFVTRFGRGTFSSAYKYKGYFRLRVSNHNLTIESTVYSNQRFSNLLLFFARLHNVQGHLGWHADSRKTLDLQAQTGSLPRLVF